MKKPCVVTQYEQDQRERLDRDRLVLFWIIVGALALGAGVGIFIDKVLL